MKTNMKYEFPKIEYIDDVLPYIKDKDEISVLKKDGYIVICYNVSKPDTFNDPISCECRGITFYEDGTIASRKYHKFFNVNEKEETLIHNIDLSQPHVIFDKLDGSMIVPFIRKDNGIIEWHTKRGKTDISQDVKEFIASFSNNYNHFVNVMYSIGMTPIFEWISPRNKIVIDYEEDNLVLTGIRMTVSGKYVSSSEMKRMAQEFNIPVVETYNWEFNKDFVENAKNMKGIEGFVVRFENGHMVKIKTEEYVTIHKSYDLFQYEKNIWDIIINQKVDDVKPFLDSFKLAKLEKFENDFWNAVYSKADMIMTIYNNFMVECGDDRKSFAMKVKELPIHPVEKTFLFSINDERNAVDVIMNFLKKNVGSSSKIEKAREIINVKF